MMGGSFEEGERQRAENETALARNKRVDLHGKILVDGHYVFLEMLRDIQTFNDYVEEHPEFLLGEKNIWLDPPPVYVAKAIRRVIELLQKTIASDECGAQHSDLQEAAGIYRPMEPDSNILIFDMKMPTTISVIKELETKAGICSNKGIVSQEADHLLALARAGGWRFWYDDAPKELAYGFKNAVLNALPHDWKMRFGKHCIWIEKEGHLYQPQRGVGTRLTIAGCEAAVDPMLNWVCLVTNNSEYAFLVEHLSRHGKAVYLLSFCDGARRSRDLMNVIEPPHHLIRKADLYKQRYNPVSEPYRSTPELCFLRSFCVDPNSESDSEAE